MKSIGLVLAFAFLVAGCAADPVGGCRSQVDCASAESCVPPGVPRVCGVPCMQQRDCESEAECSDGRVCAEYVGSCCFSGELSSRCEPRCTDGSCAAGERCDRVSGLCAVLPCGVDYACAAHTTCAPGAPGADRNGCARDACTRDADCEGGACVETLCYEGPGSCEPPAA